MRRTGRKAVATTALIITAGTGLGAVGAGVAGAAQKPTGAVQEYCAEVKQMADDFGDPGIDAIFEGNPNPSMADWAAFLPGPIARMRKFADDLEASDPPTDLAADVKTAVKRWAAVIAYYEAERSYAAAGDQKAFEAGDRRRGPLVNRLGKAMNKVGKACGIAGDGGS